MNDLKNNDSEETDELKSLWHSQKEDKSYDSEKIFKMIHRKSINSVQWLFIISLAELLLGLIITVWSYFSGGHYYLNSSIQMMGEENIKKLETFSNVGIVFSLALIGIIYYYYRKISSNSSVNTLIDNIIQFRRAVILCLVLIVLILLIVMFPIYFELGKNIAIQNAMNRTDGVVMSPEDLKTSTDAAGWVVASSATLVIAVFFFVYYFVIYGFFLRKLKKNQKELKEINS